MKVNFDLKFLHGFWGLLGNISSKLLLFSPVYILIFIAYGDSFLPDPLGNASYQVRTKINNVLTGSFIESVEENLENDKYNNDRNDKIIEQVEKDVNNRDNKK